MSVVAAVAIGVAAIRRFLGRRGAGSASADAALQGRIDHRLATMGVPAGRFAIDVDAGVVTVRGAPESDEQTRLVERLLGSMDGVREITIDVLPVPV